MHVHEQEAVSRLRLVGPHHYVGQTSRTDLWWGKPAIVFIVLSAFVAYSIWAVIQGDNYRWGSYLSPFYSPELFGSAHSWFGSRPGWWPAWLLWSPAILVLWAPAGLRLTCYYYRGAYYKAFWWDPPACAVGESRTRYWGENFFPLLVQNIHRYFIYLGLLYLIFLAHDCWEAFWFANPVAGGRTFGMGVGTMVLLIDLVLLTGYTFGCYSLRHLMGGRLSRLSECPLRAWLYTNSYALNRRHTNWAWMSLCFVAFADFYVRMCAMGRISDWRLF